MSDGSNAPDSSPRDWRMIAHVGHHQSFGSYLLSYSNAVELMFREVQNGKEPIDLLAPPLLFLMRHTLELGYKYTLWELHRMIGEPFDANSYGHHKLAVLHSALLKKHQKAVEKFDLPEKEVTEFKEYCEKTSAFQKQFVLLDDSSFRFRYPIDKAGQQNFATYQKVDLLAIKEAFDHGMILLRHTADVLGEYEDIYKWMENDAYGDWY